MVYLFMADGFEEVEGLTVVDILRRAGVELQTVSIMKRRNVISSHQVEIMADILFEEIKEAPEMLILPGGIPGTPNLKAHEGLRALIQQCAEEDVYLAAICAAPTVYGAMGLLEGKNAACYPGMESELLGAKVSYEPVVIDGKFITSRGLGTAIDFGLTLTALLKGKEEADSIARKIVYDR